MQVSAPSADVELVGLVKSYRGFSLGPVSLTIPRGVTALLGANGAGKTTLMRLVVGTARPTSGQVRREVSDSTVGFLPQDFTGPPWATARDYLAYVAWCRSTRRRRIGVEDVADALDAVGLVDRADTRIGALSGGMVRRLGVAQALLGGAPVIVLDEPTVGLDPIQRHELRELIIELGRRTTVLLSTHLAEDVTAVADRVVVLADGRLLFEGPVADLCAGDVIGSETLERGFLDLVRARTSEKADD